jgi:hypothetical protein
MADTQLLRTSAIVANAAVGTSRPPLVSAGALPLVQVKQVSPGPPIQEGQQRPVTILPPKDADSAVKTGGLPMVKVKMTDGKPKLDDGLNSSVVIRDNRNTVAAGGLPMVQVKMENGKPQVQTVPNVQSAGPQIPSARPALSQPRVARIAAPQSVQLRPTAPTQPHNQPQELPQAVASELTIDELMLGRHLFDKYLGALRVNDEGTTDNAQLAESALGKLDERIAVMTAQASEVEVPATGVAPMIQVNAAPIRAAAVGYVAPAAYAQRPRTVPTGGYVAPRPGGHGRVNVRGGNSSLAPRRVARAGQAPLPTVEVKMDGGKAIIQNQAAIVAAREAQAQAELQARAEALVAAAQPPLDPTPQQVEVLAARETQVPASELQPTEISQPTDSQG